ncbi:MAG: aldehyde dehydrogenase family protein, partial [Paracoccaceae bacterium]|nr:aldehyde dehydrogenase family protein [Paracoccaceae bacterium]
LAEEGIAGALTAKLIARLATLRVGDPLDKSTDVGAIVHPVQLARIRGLVAQGQAEGAVLHQASGPMPAKGSFFAPGFFTNVAPANTVAEVEIFGPIATLTTFRNPDEAVELANTTRYGLAASIWSENVNLCLDIAAKVKAGVVWVNCTNIFDAGAGFGGYRESGFGREGGREGMWEYLTLPDPKGKPEPAPTALNTAPVIQPPQKGDAPIDRTAKLYIGGAQKRPDSGYSYAVMGKSGLSGLAGLGSRKDIRNAVEAAHKAGGWGGATGHNRAQVLYYIAENLSARAAEFTARLRQGGASEAAAKAEVDLSIRRCFFYAAQADKFDGAVHATK